MAMKIAILEDNAGRQAIMRDCLADRFYTCDAHIFDDADEMIRFLDANLADTLVISLDNDLDMKPGPEGRCVDPGEGRQVAEFLARKQPVCPVIIHTTNSDAAAAMEEMLSAAGWKTHRVLPFDDMNWISTHWLLTLRRAIVGPFKRERSGSPS
jgi:DNA-binding NtrC family response regulator